MGSSQFRSEHGCRPALSFLKHQLTNPNTKTTPGKQTHPSTSLAPRRIHQHWAINRHGCRAHAVRRRHDPLGSGLAEELEGQLQTPRPLPNYRRGASGERQADRPESDPESRRKAYLEVQKLLVEEVPVAWLHEITFPTLYRVKVKDPVSSGIGLNDSLSRASLA